MLLHASLTLRPGPQWHVLMAPILDRSSESLTALLAQVIRAAVIEPGTLQPSAQDRARVLVGAVHGFKSTARDTQDMRRLIHDLVSMTVAGLPLPTSTCAR